MSDYNNKQALSVSLYIWSEQIHVHVEPGIPVQSPFESHFLTIKEVHAYFVEAELYWQFTIWFSLTLLVVVSKICLNYRVHHHVELAIPLHLNKRLTFFVYDEYL